MATIRDYNFFFVIPLFLMYTQITSAQSACECDCISKAVSRIKTEAEPDLGKILENVHQYSPLHERKEDAAKFAAAWDLNDQAAAIIHLLVEPALLLPTWGQRHHESRATGPYEEAAKVIIYRISSDRSFRDRYIRLVAWSGLLVIAPKHPTVSQVDVIGFTFAGIKERYESQSDDFFWQDTLCFVSISLMLGYDVSYGETFTRNMTRKRFLLVLDWVKTHRFVVAADGYHWTTGESGAVIAELPELKLPPIPFENGDLLSAQSFRDLRSIIEAMAP
ncbi:hypothetical protein [Planctomycetes bacterium CA13]